MSDDLVINKTQNQPIAEDLSALLNDPKLKYYDDIYNESLKREKRIEKLKHKYSNLNPQIQQNTANFPHYNNYATPFQYNGNPSINFVQTYGQQYPYQNQYGATQQPYSPYNQPSDFGYQQPFNGQLLHQINSQIQNPYTLTANDYNTDFDYDEADIKPNSKTTKSTNSRNKEGYSGNVEDSSENEYSSESDSEKTNEKKVEVKVENKQELSNKINNIRSQIHQVTPELKKLRVKINSANVAKLSKDIREIMRTFISTLDITGYKPSSEFLQKLSNSSNIEDVAGRFKSDKSNAYICRIMLRIGKKQQSKLIP